MRTLQFFVAFLTLATGLASASASDRETLYDRSCADFVAAEVINYLDSATGGRMATQLTSVQSSFAGADRDGEWVEVYRVTVDLAGTGRSYFATLNSSCRLQSLTAAAAAPLNLSVRPISFCETYEDDCERDNDDNGVPDNDDEDGEGPYNDEEYDI